MDIIGAVFLIAVIGIVFYICTREDLCRHQFVRCIHGDEINSTIKGWGNTHKVARQRCLVCGRAIYHKALPYICTVTGRPHSPWFDVEPGTEPWANPEDKEG